MTTECQHKNWYVFVEDGAEKQRCKGCGKVVTVRVLRHVREKKYRCCCGYQTNNISMIRVHMINGNKKDGDGTHKFPQEAKV
jgi:lysyl-tRNA synthetase class I